MIKYENEYKYVTQSRPQHKPGKWKTISSMGAGTMPALFIKDSTVPVT